MVYALHKFRHYMLGNMFTFYVNHMALVYLINKPQVFGKLTRWLLLFLEYDFKIVYKLGRFHLMENALSSLLNQIKPIGIPDRTCDVHLFTLQLEWLQNVYEYTLKGVMLEKFITSQKQYLAQIIKPFMFQEGTL